MSQFTQCAGARGPDDNILKMMHTLYRQINSSSGATTHLTIKEEGGLIVWKKREREGGGGSEGEGRG